MKRLLAAVGAAAALLVLAGVLVTSSFPDGLERVAEGLGFSTKGTPLLQGPFAGYETRFFRSRWVAQASAGLVGVVLLYGFGLLFGRALKRKNK